MGKDMVIELGRQLQIESFHVVADVARPEPRQEIHAVLMLARHNDGKVTAGDVSKELLDGRSEVARRLLHICQVYGLVQGGQGRDPARLTAEGERALDRGQVFVAEHGVWTIWATLDPLLPGRLLRIEPYGDEPTAKDEVLGDKEAEQRDIEEIPRWLCDLKGDEVVPPAGDGRAVRLEDIEEKGERCEPECTLRVLVRIPPEGAADTRLEGNIAGTQVSCPIPSPDVTHHAAWEGLLERHGFLRRWDSSGRVLRVRVEKLSDAAKVSFKMAVLFKMPQLPLVGVFDETKVDGVPIVPLRQSDADAWAEWLLVREVRSYVTSDAYGDLCGAVVGKFPDFRVVPPEQVRLARDIRDSVQADEPMPSTYWHLIAPLDWQL